MGAVDRCGDVEFGAVLEGEGQLDGVADLHVGLHAHEVVAAGRECDAAMGGDGDAGDVHHHRHAAGILAFVEHEHAAGGRGGGGKGGGGVAVILNVHIGGGRDAGEQVANPRFVDGDRGVGGGQGGEENGGDEGGDEVQVEGHGGSGGGVVGAG